MRNFIYLLFFITLLSCASNNKVYWCGDHKCKNKKEKEAYFKKTMIVEVKNTTKKEKTKKSEIEKLFQKAEINKGVMSDDEKSIFDEKKLTKEEKKLEKATEKQAKLDEKKRIKREKEESKQAKLDEKKRIKEEKALAKQIDLEEKKRIKDEKKMKNNTIKQVKIDKNPKKGELKGNLAKGDQQDKFIEIVERINKKNIFRPYPDINDIPQ